MLMRKCFDSLKQEVDIGKTEKYSYYAAKYKSEAELKLKYFQMFAAFARTNVSKHNKNSILKSVSPSQQNQNVPAFLLLHSFKADQENQAWEDAAEPSKGTQAKGIWMSAESKEREATQNSLEGATQSEIEHSKQAYQLWQVHKQSKLADCIQEKTRYPQ